MVHDTDRQRGAERLPPEESWRVGKVWLGVLFTILAVANVVLSVPDLVSGDAATAGRPARPWLSLALAAAFLAMAVGELRRRVAVDTDGIHFIETLRRRTYLRQDVAEVQLGRPTAFGDRFVYLLRLGEKHVELPNSGGHLRLLQRWHEAMSSR